MSLFHISWLETQPHSLIPVIIRSPNSLTFRHCTGVVSHTWLLDFSNTYVYGKQSLERLLWLPLWGCTPYPEVQRLFCRVPHWELSQFHLEINHLSHQIHNEPTKCLQVLLFITQWALKDDIESFINHKLEQLSCFQNRIPNKGNPVLYYRQELQISQASEVLFQPPSWFPFHMTREVPWNYYLKLLSLK